MKLFLLQICFFGKKYISLHKNAYIMAKSRKKRVPNERDFKEGILFLKKEASKLGLYISISNCQWIVPLSRILSEGGNCKIFWVNTCAQGNIPRIPKCVLMNDIFYGDGKYLFNWVRTPQGHEYWCGVADEIISKTSNKRFLIDL
jgi:hypothetical protein